MQNKVHVVFIILFILVTFLGAQDRIRDYGIMIGSLKPGNYNAITDVPGVKVGHFTLISGKNIRTGVTAIIPHSENIFQNKVPAAVCIGNGFGKLAGYSQVEELGNIETPIILTNTLSVPKAADALIDYTLSVPLNSAVRSVNPIIGETNDGILNDIRGRYVKKDHILEAINNATSGDVEEGAVGAGTGTRCFGYKGGIGTSSRVIKIADTVFTLGVLVQTNFGGSLTIAGIPMKHELKKGTHTESEDGSCMIIVATDAPLSARNLKRLAKRALFGLARTGGYASNGSGDYVIAFSTAKDLRISYNAGGNIFLTNRELRNDKITPLFQAAIEATEEAICNSLFAAETMSGNGATVTALPKDKVVEILKKRAVINDSNHYR